MTTSEKAEAILKKVLELTNKKGNFTFEQDFGDFTATISSGNSHTHVGIPSPDGSWEQLVDNLYDSLHDGPGLSWHEEVANPDGYKEFGKAVTKLEPEEMQSIFDGHEFGKAAQHAQNIIDGMPPGPHVGGGRVVDQCAGENPYIIRDKHLTKEEADKYDEIRKQIAGELPDLIARHRLREFKEFLDNLSTVVKIEAIWDWLAKPNTAFDGFTPLQMVKFGEMQRLKEMYWQMISGSAS